MPILRYFAAARAAAEVAEEQVPGDTLEEALDRARMTRSDRFTDVLRVCTFLVDGKPVGARGHGSVALAEDAVVDCLPPYAGG